MFGIDGKVKGGPVLKSVPRHEEVSIV